MSNWKKCIITFADFPGIKKLAASGRASTMMTDLHGYISSQAMTLLPSHSGVYIWNDSILLVAYFTARKDKERILREQSAFKTAIDERVPGRHRPYAIVVQGKSFPSPPIARRSLLDPQIVALKSSSWAMANCFHIERVLGKRRAVWYIDSRITADLKLGNKQRRLKLRLFPANRMRSIVLIHDHQLRFS
jgi:hypothetical protein